MQCSRPPTRLQSPPLSFQRIRRVSPPRRLLPRHRSRPRRHIRLSPRRHMESCLLHLWQCCLSCRDHLDSSHVLVRHALASLPGQRT
ncbi:hypothetical protein DL95DRAFT_383692 [Leptodontidium sp. 2 PMI_412]|nr:hypothetical protein DL95DRAFT_383692 [Leptodontidium sp. 2 PMI_412]